MSTARVIDWGADNPNDYDHFLGFGKKNKAFKQAKRDIRLQKKTAKVDRIQSRSDSRRTLADLGVDQQTGIGSVASALHGALGLAGGMAGGGIGGILGGAMSAIGGGGQQQQIDPGTISPPYIAPVQSSIGQQQQQVQQAVDSGAMYPQDQAYDTGRQRGVTDDAGDPNDPNSPAGKAAKKKKDNNMLLIGGAVLLVIVIVLFMALGGKKG